ncbi:MAG: hypothetical protein PVG45_12500, partial [Gammaproteobacteria bacterium]
MKTYQTPLNAISAAVLLASACTLPTGALAQYVPLGDKESLSEVYPGKAYSPYAERSFPSQVYWGETHLHTA